MKKYLAVLCLILNMGTAFAGNEGANGGDAFDRTAEGAGFQFFDFIEYGDPFHPSQLTAFQVLRDRLDGLATKMPLTAEFLRHIFRGGATWYFVNPELKEVKPTGETLLILTYKKVQLALADTEKRVILINRGT